MTEPRTDTPLLTPRFIEALEFALTHHATQLRKGSQVPYAAHLLGVASLTLEMDGDEDEAIGALLHDAIEDGGGPEMGSAIEARFGERVARIVRANSDTDEVPKPPWQARKEAYIAAVAHKAPDEIRVSLADKLHNARAILTDYRRHGEDLWSRFKAGEGKSVRWYYRELAVAFRARENHLGPAGRSTLAELEWTLDELDRLADLGGAHRGMAGDRLARIERTIAETTAWIDATQAENGIERAFSAPGDWDYDNATDLDAIVEQTRTTREALEAERACILNRQTFFEAERASRSAD